VGTLYVVATPIGNLEDISARALRVLREVRVIAAEDTRHTGRLLRHFGIDTPTISYHAHNEREREGRLLAELALGDVALVSDAGTPGISDPGTALVAAAARAGFPVSPVPGPSSLSAALSAAGLGEGPMLFLGFLPRERGARQRTLARAAASGALLVLFESPNRVAGTLEELAALLGGQRPAVVARELTKLHEELRRGSLRELAAWGQSNDLRGEVVVMVEPGDAVAEGDDLPALIDTLRRSGLGASEAAREAAKMTGLPRSELYPLARAWTPEQPGQD
jgi:16S rRNA (cytidine1402-2'-O)-methyltransferase